MIPGVILAAGRSTRMGRPKALLALPGGDDTFLSRIVRVLLEGGVADVLVVGRPDDRPLREAIDLIGRRAQFIDNPRADTGQLSSVIAGLNAADRPGIRALLVTPVDLPLVRASSIAALLTAFSSSSRAVARATYGGRHGHPVVFGRAVFDALRRADPATGAKAVVRAHPVLDVEVDDPGVLLDIDTPEDYQALRNRVIG
jgi:CTP:molybdopterin cytidylyltransferase MocA